jgi:hypothetical protein
MAVRFPRKVNMKYKTLPPFRTGPSNIARYFFHDCDRFLRFSSTRSALAAAQGVPTSGFDTSPVMRAVLDAGYGWEEEVLTKLGKKAAVAIGPGKVHERRFTYEQTLALLKTQPAGIFIYQATLRPPDSFYERFGLDATLIQIGDNHPDLIQVLAGDDGRRLFRVLDLKRGASMRATYRIQVLLYALQLDLILREHGIDADADLDTGGVWLGGEDFPETCDLASVRPHLEAFLRHDLPRILTTPMADVDWHLYFRCEWCGYFDHCQQEMQKTDNISRLTRLTVNGKRHLIHEAKVRTLPELDQFLKRKDADEVLARCASLAGRRPHLRAQVDAFKTGKPVMGKASTPALPIWESVGVVLTLQQEPLGKKIYLAGMLVQVSKKDQPRLFGEDADPELFKPRVWVAANDKSEDLAAVRKQFIAEVYELLLLLHRFNQGKEWADQVGVQCYVHSEHEKTLLVELLMQALLEPELAETAMALLFHFQGPDLLLTDDHPNEAVQYPLVVLLGVLGRLAALPVEVSYSLPESLKALGSTFNYERKDFFHFPLGPGLKPDPIYLAWSRGKGENVDRITQQAKMHLWAVRALLTQFRQLAKDNLFAWPPKFSLPQTTDIKDPLLSKMAFFARYESVLGCLGVREHRSEDREVLDLLGQLIELEAVEPPMYKVIGDAVLDLGDGGFPRFLLTRDTPEGRRSQLEFPDYYYRGKPYGKKHEHRAVAGVADTTRDKLGCTRSVEVNATFDDYEPSKGDRFLLYERYTDFNSEKVVKHLKQLDAAGVGLFLKLIRDPVKASQPVALPKAIEKTAAEEEKDLKLTPSQLLAYRKVRQRRIVAVWGPPGTGKTHYLASMILGLASAHARAGKPLRVLVTAFTHASIENVLRKVASLRENTGAKKLRIGKVNGWKGQGKPPGDEIENGYVGDWLAEAPLAVVGATVWGCLKEDDSVVFDIVIVDEASQVRVPESSIAVSRVAGNGRLVLAGDHMRYRRSLLASIRSRPRENPCCTARSSSYCCRGQATATR